STPHSPPSFPTRRSSDLPISSRTLLARLQEMEHDEILLRNDYGGLPRRVEYELTERGRRLLPLLDALMKTGQALDCNECEDRKRSEEHTSELQSRENLVC